jgi:hypothetical protein
VPGSYLCGHSSTSPLPSQLHTDSFMSYLVDDCSLEACKQLRRYICIWHLGLLTGDGACTRNTPRTHIRLAERIPIWFYNLLIAPKFKEHITEFKRVAMSTVSRQCTRPRHILAGLDRWMRTSNLECSLETRKPWVLKGNKTTVGIIGCSSLTQHMQIQSSVSARSYESE